MIGNITVNNTIVDQGLSVSGNVTFRSSLFCNTNENKVFTFDGAGLGRLGFKNNQGLYPKICAGTGTSILFSHLGSGEITQTISSTGISVSNRMIINPVGNVGIGTSGPNFRFRHSFYKFKL